MALAKDIIKDYFKANGIESEDCDEKTLVMFGELSIGRANVFISVEEDQNYISFILTNFCTVPDEKTDDICKLLNQINSTHRFVKFYLKDNQIYIRTDAIVPLDACGAISFEYVFWLVKTLEENYEEIIRGLEL